ncbi:unnamed protein product, partial [Amoebophrya sp. A25]
KIDSYSGDYSVRSPPRSPIRPPAGPPEGRKLIRPDSAPALPVAVRRLIDGNGGRRRENHVQYREGNLSKHRTRELQKDDYHRALDHNGRLQDVKTLLEKQQSTQKYDAFKQMIAKREKLGPKFPRREDLMEIECYFNKRDYQEEGPNGDLADYDGRFKRDKPGTLQMIFVFYARLYQVLQNV